MNKINNCTYKKCCYILALFVLQFCTPASSSYVEGLQDVLDLFPSCLHEIYEYDVGDWKLNVEPKQPIKLLSCTRYKNQYFKLKPNKFYSYVNTRCEDIRNFTETFIFKSLEKSSMCSAIFYLVDWVDFRQFIYKIMDPLYAILITSNPINHPLFSTLAFKYRGLFLVVLLRWKSIPSTMSFERLYEPKGIYFACYYCNFTLKLGRNGLRPVELITFPMEGKVKTKSSSSNLHVMVSDRVRLSPTC